MGGESIKPIRKRIHVYFLMTAYLPKGIDLNQAVNRTGFVGDFLFKLGHLT